MIPTAGAIRRLPILLLEPCAGCNCRCVMCEIWRRPPTDVAPLERMRDWIGAGVEMGVRELVLTGGEPLLHPAIESLLEVAADAGLRLTVLSSGLLLSARAQLLRRHADRVVVSLDGPPPIHDRIRRVPRAFERLARGVDALRSGRPRPRLVARCTVQAANIGSLAETVRTARDAGFDQISFLAVDTSSEAFNRNAAGEAGTGAVPRRRPADGVAPGVPALEQLAREIEALETELAPLFQSGFIAESPAKLRARVLAPLRAARGLEPPVAPRCNAPWVSAVIETDGTVRPCFFQAAYGVLGLRGETLQSVLNGEGARRFRRRLNVARDPICRRCVCHLYYRGTTEP